MTVRIKEQASTFLVFKASKNPLKAWGLMVVNELSLCSFTKKRSKQDNATEGMATKNIVVLHPRGIKSTAAIKGANVDPSMGIDKFSPRILPLLEGSEYSVMSDAPIGCWGLLPNPLPILMAINC